MAIRTDDEAVQAILGDDYGARADGSFPSLAPFIRAANVMVNQIVRFGPNAMNPLMQSIATDTTTLKEIEGWLAAHSYVQSDQNFASKSTGGASGSHQGQTAMELDGSKYGQTAKQLDYSGILVALSKRQVAGGAWLGKTVSEQIPYNERD